MNLVTITTYGGAASRDWRSCSKLWVSSLLRHQWDGKVVLRHNFVHPVFAVGRESLEEKEVLPDAIVGPGKEMMWRDMGRWNAIGYLEELEEKKLEPYEWLLLADADCVCLRNMDHLFASEADVGVLVSMVNGMPDPGFLAVRANKAKEFANTVRACGGLMGKSLANALSTTGWKSNEFERGEVLRPSDPGVTLSDLANATVVHFTGMPVEEKHRLAFAFHMMGAFHDKDGLFFDLLES